MRRSFWVIGLLVIVGGFAGFQQYSSWSLNRPQADSQTKSDNPATEKPGAQSRSGGRARGGEAVPVTVATAVQKNIPVQIRAVGNVEPYSTVSIKSQVTGVITQAHFREGQDVKKGQLLFTIDPRPLEAALKQAEANLARDAAQLNNWREQVKRYRELVDKQYVSKEQYDQIKTNADAAEAVVDADKAASAFVLIWSYCSFDTYCLSTNSRYRLTCSRQLLSCAASRAKLASACFKAASSGRGSMVNSSCPFLTSCPSLKCAWVITPVTWLLIETVEYGSTFPTARICTGMFF